MRRGVAGRRPEEMEQGRDRTGEQRGEHQLPPGQRQEHPLHAAGFRLSVHRADPDYSPVTSRRRKRT